VSDASEIPLLIPEHVADLPEGKAHGVVSGALCVELGDWRFAFVDLATGASEEVTFHGVDVEQPGLLRVLPDREHLVFKDGDGLSLWHALAGRVAFAPLRPCPRDARGRPEWDGCVLTGDRLWYFGYDADGLPLLSLFDLVTFELLDTHEPTTTLGWPRPEVPERLRQWGDLTLFTGRGGAGSPGCFANSGDSFSYFVFVDEQDRRIVSPGAPELEPVVGSCTDEIMRDIAVLDARTLVVCDDMGVLSLVGMEPATRRHRGSNPIWAFEEDDRSRIPGFDGSCGSFAYLGQGLRLGASHIHVPYELDEAPDGDMPSVVVCVVDPETLETVALVVPERIDGLRSVRMLDADMLIGTKHDGTSALYRLPEAPRS